ncbi:hypothetical protein B9Z19DRAFT_1121680 [Tuber borchii]|uniref:Uncharacterized protein n=1 Tax=Tuber borchii TaxID=42251 RepID=A0A2T7A217_TUBBO|nr:hypothetical protein B9Z19DRAFT_1121680 [Tuber borchii]
MVALMAKVVSANHDHIDHFTKVKGTEIIEGILDDDEGIKPTFPILDALANICICLTIAENGPITESINSYLPRIWKLLQELGAEFAAQRELDREPGEWIGYKGPSPSMPVGVRTDTKLTIFRRIYDYTQEKTRCRKERWWPRLVDFMSRLKQARGGHLTGWELELNIVFRALKRAYKIHDLKTSQKYRDLDHWRNLHALLEVAAQRVKTLTDDNNPFCKDTAAFIEPDPAEVFHLGDTLLKLTSQQRHFQTLISFAHSPRLQEALSCHMSLAFVQPPPEPVVRLPCTAQEWREVIDKIAGDYYPSGVTWPNTEAIKIYQKLSRKKSRTQLRMPSRFKPHYQIHGKSDHQSQTEARLEESIPVWVHCECALIEHLEGERNHCASPDWSSPTGLLDQDEEWQDLPRCEKEGEGRKVKAIQDKCVGGKSNTNPMGENWQGVPPFSYLGMSKLSCAPCQLWIQGNNTLPGRTFYTRGTHGKWYWPWGMPEMNKDLLSVYMVEKISLAYLKHCRAKFHLRNLSDGSTAAIHDALTSSDPEVESLMQALLLDED